MSEPDNRDSIYHSMQLKVEKRFSAGAQVLARYTVSKLIDDTNSEINWLEAAAPSWNDFDVYNRRSFRSLDGFDVPQRLVLGTVLDLPFGRGKKFASDVNGVANKVIGGWGVNTIITFQKGFPIIIGGCPGPLSSSGPSGSRLCPADENCLFALTWAVPEPGKPSGTILQYSPPASPRTSVWERSASNPTFVRRHQEL